MKKQEIYVTFIYIRAVSEDKLAVECKDIYEAREVAQDACSFGCVKNVRIRRSGKPNDREIMSYQDYWLKF